MSEKTDEKHSDVKCPLCQKRTNTLHANAQDIEYFTSDTTYQIRNCDPCGILFVHPMLADKLGEIYPKNYYSFGVTATNFAQRIKERLDQRRFRQISSSIKGDSLRALDIGGGTGWLLDMIKAVDPRFDQTTVVDIDDGARVHAENAGHEYFHGRFEDFGNSSNKKYDLILMLNLIEHVPNPGAVLEKASKLLRPGGLIWIKTPNFDALDARIFRHRSWAGYHTPRHFVIFKKESLLKTAALAGLECEKFSYTQGAPFWSISVLNEFRILGLIKGTRERPMIYHPLTPLFQAAAAAFDFMRSPFSKLSQMELLLKNSRDEN